MISSHQRLIWQVNNQLRYFCMFVSKMHTNKYLADYFNQNYILPMFIRADEYFELAGSVPQFFVPLWNIVDLIMFADFTVIIYVNSIGGIDDDIRI